MDTRKTPAAVNAFNGRDRRQQKLLIMLAGFFVGNAMLAELVGGKLFQVPTGLSLFGQANFAFTLSCGVILWPVVFIMTDIINEYFGRSGVRRLSILTAVIISYAFVALWLTQLVPTADFSPVDENSFNRVFLQSRWIIVGSITAFLIAQLIDVTVFWIIRRQTGHKWLWLRATGSTLISQIFDTFIVQFIGLYMPGWFDIPGALTFPQYVNSASSGYLFKLLVAIGITPVLYLVHAWIDRYLGEQTADQLIESTAQREHAEDQ